MAIVQISQIQIRRGLQQDLPQLASAEMGWSLDSRRLYIGNGTLEEGAPTEGVTEILTQYSDFLSTIPNYIFAGTDSGYTSQTGLSSLSPITRTLQSVLDDMVSARDFGAVGNGTTDDTAALNRAIEQIYKNSLNNADTWPNVRRTIKIPAGTYSVTGTIYIPPNCTLIGDGKNNTIIKSSTGTTILKTCDALFQYDGAIGSVGATLPEYIFIAGIKFVSTSGTDPIAVINSASTVNFENVYFSGAGTINDLVTTTTATITPSSDITFSRCVFDGGVNGYTATGLTNGVRLTDSKFVNNSGSGINITSDVSGLLSSGNYFDTTTAISGLASNSYSVGDTDVNATEGGIYSGSAKIGTGNVWVLSSGTTTIGALAMDSGAMDYLLDDGAGNYRYGTLKFNNSVSGSTFDDDFTEPNYSMGANVFVDSAGTLSCTVSSTTTFKYNIKQFV